MPRDEGRRRARAGEPVGFGRAQLGHHLLVHALWRNRTGGWHHVCRDSGASLGFPSGVHRHVVSAGGGAHHLGHRGRREPIRADANPVRWPGDRLQSADLRHLAQVHLTVDVVRWRAPGRLRKGVASTFLAERLRPGHPAPIYLQPSHGFTLPPDPATPIIMVGPGTGVAPFRSFLHERRATGGKGRSWLFFGHQRRASDFFYEDEFAALLKAGTLTQLSTAFSRDQAQKVYVQHRLLEQAGEIFRWLEEGAHFYVCGDASRMARDVDDALRQIIAKEGGLTPESATAYLDRLRAEKRYARDVY